MINIFDNYLDTAFGEHKQADFKIKQFRKNYFRFFPTNKKAKLLDIGPGRGEMLTCMKNEGYQNVKAIDISSSIVDFCTNLGYDCELVENTQSYLEQHKNSYDFISMCDVLEHVPKVDVLDLLFSLRESLTKDGTAIIQVPNMQSADANLYMYYDFTHEAGYPEHSLFQILKTCGFSKIDFYGFEYLDNSFKSKVHAFIRSIYWKKLKIKRKINGNIPHHIFHPVFFATIKK